jgi:signal transduction histidine kinase
LGLAWLFEHPTETGLFGGAHYGLFALVGLLLSGIIYFLLCLPEHLRRHLQASHTAQIRSEMRFHDAIEALTDGFVIFDAQRRLVLYNDNFLKLYKPLTPAMKLGVTYEALREYARATGFIQTPAPGELDTPPPRVGTRDVQLADGRWHRIVERPMHDGGTVGFHSDITDLKNREQELRAATQLAETANRAKTQFLANVSHEVRTPLNAILGLMEVILEDQTLQSQQRFYMSTVQESADCLLKILNDILDASKMEAGMLNLKLAPFDLQATLLAVAQLMTKSAECKGLTLVTEFSLATQTWLVGDAGRIRQVLVNLVSNAVKFTEAGSITLRASCRPQTAQQVILCVEVIDTGIGIKPEAIADLFKPFTQIESNCQKSHDGTGLGLSICAHLVELMGGQIELQSEQGRGSQVSLLLPLSVRAPEAAPQPLVSQEQNNQRPLRILLADDGEANQVVIRAMLSDTSYQLDTANDGSEALDAIGKADYDLILMDIYMPTMDGVTAAQRIRETHTTPIVAITANAMEGDRDRFIAAGMNEYLAKPLDKQQLLTTIARLTA